MNRLLSGLLNRPTPVDPANKYWNDRRDILYYQLVRWLVNHVGRKANSILDVGSAGCPYLDWFDFIPVRTSVDLKKPYRAKGVSSYMMDFLLWEPNQKYDVVLCLQVLEHVPDPSAFAQKLLKTGQTVVVSVPYKWPRGKTKSHIHDPVDEAKLKSWFGREPDYYCICREIAAPVERMIQIYRQSDSRTG